MDLRDSHLRNPSDADLLRGAADCLRMALGQLACIGEASMNKQIKLALLANIQLAEHDCEQAAMEFGAKQAIAVARAMPE